MAAPEMLGVLVPAEHIAKIIGKAGAGLKQVREASGVKIQVDQKTDSSGGMRRIDLIGLAEQVVSAFQLILGKAFPDGNGTPTLFIPSDKAGQVVGRGGDNLKKLREECRVRVQLEREPFTDPSSGAQERLLTMQGEMAQMGRAVRFIIGAGLTPSATPPTTLALPAPGGVVRQAISNVRAPSGDPDEVQLQLTIPDRLAGAILGKAGAQVKQTAATAGCRVAMTNRGQGPERRAVMVGTYSQCAIAQGLLYDQLVEASRAAGQDLTEVSVTYLIRKEAAGAVIGKQGATLKQIRETSGAKVQLAKEEVEQHRPCTLTGTLQSIMHAEKCIFDLVRQVPVNAGAATAYAGAAFPATPYAGAGYAAYDAAGANKRADAPLLAPTAKRQRLDDSEATTKLLVPAQCAGAVIGKQGSGLKEIRETTHAHVEMLQQAQAPQWPNDRVVILNGSPAARQAAVLAVLRMAYQMSSDSCSLKMLITGPQAGSIIGKQGNTLKYIREQCGVSVQVEREEIFGERLVTATGPQGAVCAAAIAIGAVLDSHAQGGGGQQPGGGIGGGCGFVPEALPTALPAPGAYVQ